MKLNVNGAERTIDVDPDMPLLWALRDELHLTGVKYGCGIGQCGACTVLLDGAPIRSCGTPVRLIGKGKITTIENAGDAVAAAVQAAWIEHDVPQCGYCQSGQILSAEALLAGNKSPTDADIDAAMAGNLCRCATYNRIRAAIHTAAGTLSK
jgi:isoquinoline 1-oxidoreductase alpha subunit